MSNHVNLGPQQSYEYFLTVAPSNPTEIVGFRTDAHLVQHNALRGLDAALAHEEQIKADLPKVDIDELRDIQPLTHALVFAAGLVNRTPEATLLRERMPQASGLRRKMFSSATALVEAGLLPEREVEIIRRGNGKVDSVEDLPQLSSLFRRHESAIQGRHAIVKEDLELADELGRTLLEILRPGASTSTVPVSPELAASVEARDRLWTLLSNRHLVLWKAGAWLFGPDVTTKVPSLRSRKVTKKAADTPAQPKSPTTDPVPT